MAGEGMQTRLLPGQNLALQQVLSPQLQQSLLVLQTPLLELRNLVQQEMETNPVLEELPDEPGADERGEVSQLRHGRLSEFTRSERQAPVLFRFHCRAGNASAKSAGATESDHAQRRRPQSCRANR